MKRVFVAASLLFVFSLNQAMAQSCSIVQQGYSVVVDGRPFSALSSNDDCWLFVSVEKSSSGGVAVLRNTQGRFVLDHTVNIDSEVFGETLTHDGKHLIVAARSRTLVLNVERLEHNDSAALEGSLSDGRGAGAIYAAVTHDDQTLFVSDEDKKRLSVFDLGRAQASQFHDVNPTGNVPTGVSPVGLAMAPDGRWLYAASEGGATRSSLCAPESKGERQHPQVVLLVIDAMKARQDAAHALISAFPAGCNPVRVAPSPEGDRVWISARGDNELLRIQSVDWSVGVDHIQSASFAISQSNRRRGPTRWQTSLGRSIKSIWEHECRSACGPRRRAHRQSKNITFSACSSVSA
jgi:DNA-binding beta-propeller fold protein YncE